VFDPNSLGGALLAKFLRDVLVLDFTRVLAGPFCTMTLADLGARVIKIESPAGDEARGMGPFKGGNSLYFASINRGKESVVLDLKQPAGRDAAIALAAKADVLVENYRPGAMQRLGLGYEALAEVNPRLIYASLSGFGQTGPYRDRGAYDVIIQAMSGMMGITGQVDGQPTRVGASIGDMIPALYTVGGIMGALFERTQTGEGCHIDVAMMDSVFALTENALARFWLTGDDPAPLGNRHPAIAPFSSFATRDGLIVIACGNDALWARLCDCLELPEGIRDARFVSNSLRTENAATLAEYLEARLAEKRTEDWLEILLEAGVPAAKVNRMSDLADDPHLRARNMVVPIEQDGIGTMLTPGSPIKSNRSDDRIGAPAPALGAHTRQVLEELAGLSAVESAELAESIAANGNSGADHQSPTHTTESG
jgi:CoA:oxalate CoA-transferase